MRQILQCVVNGGSIRVKRTVIKFLGRKIHDVFMHAVLLIQTELGFFIQDFMQPLEQRKRQIFFIALEPADRRRKLTMISGHHHFAGMKQRDPGRRFDPLRSLVQNHPIKGFGLDQRVPTDRMCGHNHI